MYFQGESFVSSLARLQWGCFQSRQITVISDSIHCCITAQIHKRKKSVAIKLPNVQLFFFSHYYCFFPLTHNMHYITLVDGNCLDNNYCCWQCVRSALCALRFLWKTHLIDHTRALCDKITMSCYFSNFFAGNK